MKLYKVTCYWNDYGNKTDIDIYVLANSPLEAQEKAISKITKENLLFNDGVSNIEELANTSAEDEDICWLVK